MLAVSCPITMDSTGPPPEISLLVKNAIIVWLLIIPLSPRICTVLHSGAASSGLATASADGEDGAGRRTDMHLPPMMCFRASTLSAAKTSTSTVVFI